MEERFKTYKIMSLLISVILVFFSIFMILKPGVSVIALIVSLGVIVLLDGIIHIISYLRIKKEFKSFNIELIRGIMNFIIGLIIIINPSIFTNFLPIIIGVWIVIQSIVKLQFAFNMKKAEDKNWLIILLFAIITLIIGLVVIFYPFEVIKQITTICGIILLVSETINISELLFIMIRKR
jgi:uncharacterized membrane protein HdeD (DUF308 family)